MIDVEPTQLRFKLQAADRHAGSVVKVMGAIDSHCYSDRMYQRQDIQGKTLVHGGDSLLIASAEENEVAESRIFISGVSPFYQIDMDVVDVHAEHKPLFVGAMIQSGDTDVYARMRMAAQSNSRLSLCCEVVVMRGKAVLQQTDFEEITLPMGGFHFRTLVSGSDKLTLSLAKDGGEIYSYSTQLTQVNFYNKDVFDQQASKVCLTTQLPPRAVVELQDVQVAQSCGVGQADPRILHYEDGTPIMEDDRVYIGMSTRGVDHVESIFSMNSNGTDWHLEGQMLFDVGGDTYRNYTAADVMFNRIDHKWYIFPISHIDDHQICVGTATRDIRFGVNIVDVKRLNYRNTGNDEDIYVVYDADCHKWRAIYCSAQPRDGYGITLAQADEILGEWHDLASRQSTSYTGPIIQQIGNRRYVIAGRGVDRMEVLSYPELKPIGEIDYDGKTTSRNIWPVIFPVAVGSRTCYGMLTFDRIAPLGRWSYGGVYFYRSQLFKTDEPA